MKDINLKDLQDIQIPEGLEERLSAKIDLWEQEELMAKAPVRKPAIALRWWHYASIAACVAAVVGAIVLFDNNEKEDVIAIKQDVKLVTTNTPDNAPKEDTTKSDSKAIGTQKPSAKQSTHTEQLVDDNMDSGSFNSAEHKIVGQIAGFDQEYYQEQLNKEAERDLADTYSALEEAFAFCEQKQIDMLRAIHASLNQ